MKKNILISHIHMKTGGIETSLVNLLSMLDKNKYNIDLVLYYMDGNLLDLIPKWVNVIPIWKLNKKNKENLLLKKIVMSRNIILRILKNIIFRPCFAKLFVPNKKYDYAFGYSGYFNFTDTLAGVSNSNKKLIWVHADFYTQCQIDKKFNKDFKSIYKKYKLFDKIVCVSNKAADNFKILCPELANKVTSQWNINKKREITATSKSQNIKLSGTYNIIAIARLAKYKGIERLVDVASLLNNYNIDYKIYVLGDGPSKEEIQNMIKNNCLEKKFILLGNIENVFNIINQADLYVSPSDSEGFSSVTLEALLSGVPVVATPTASSIDIFNNIAPNNSMLLSNDFSKESICSTILKAHKGAISKGFLFDIDKLNHEILNYFETTTLS